MPNILVILINSQWGLGKRKQKTHSTFINSQCNIMKVMISYNVQDFEFSEFVAPSILNKFKPAAVLMVFLGCV